MIVPALTDEAIQAMHALIAKALAEDDASTENPRFGVRQFPDWKAQADEFEAEMLKRELAFTPIDWTPKS